MEVKHMFMKFDVTPKELELLKEFNFENTCRFGRHQEDRLNACQNRIRQLNQRAQNTERLVKTLRERIEKLEELRCPK